MMDKNKSCCGIHVDSTNHWGADAWQINRTSARWADDDVLGEIDANEQDLVCMLINHPVLTDAIVVSLQNMSEMNAGVIMEHLDNVVQSNKTMDVSDHVNINVEVIRVPSGSGHMYLTYPKTDVLKKWSVIGIDNNDILCLARSISMAWVHANVICADEWHDLCNESDLNI